HDDQHGTAIISCAALINALSIANKKIGKTKIVINGAGAAAVSCAKLYLALGAKKANMLMVDSKGVITTDRDNLDEQKQFFASKTKLTTLAEAMVGSDVFLGLSKGDIVSAEMIKSMADNPIVFALANPVPEIPYKTAVNSREDIIMATGRSDHPNQVNNVLGFPFIFRGALDVRATCINEEMKLAAVYAIANLAKEHVPESVNEAYGTKNILFGKDYIIPKPLDPRLITTVAPAVAKAAIESGVALEPITDWDAYVEELESRLGHDSKLVRSMTERAKHNPQRVVFAEADNYKILKAAQIVKDEGIAEPILLGKKKKIEALIEKYQLDLGDIEIIDPRSEEEEERRLEFAQLLFEKRQRKGMTFVEAQHEMRERNYFGATMVEMGHADALISGLTRNYPDTIRPALQIIGVDKEAGVNRIAGMYILITKRGPIFFADTTINTDPTAEELAEIAVMAADSVKRFKMKPNVALLSYSNFGSATGDDPKKVRKAVKILHEQHPNLTVDGEMQANFAMNKTLLKDIFPFSQLSGKNTNTLIFPNLSSGNIAYKLIQEMTSAEAIGPILLGMKKAVHILQLGSSVREIVNMITIAVVDAQTRKK
ncbi:MAG: NADP-dependent malic enzyme, partial [Flavobacteriales bacterium]|nr:NADP-dependent malic enzyme [Flavobacteriales bacterium]